jgi:putative acetyltransferase
MAIVIDSLSSPDDAAAFRRLNVEWIELLFTMEAEDLRTLDDPFGTIIDPGGDILVARDGDDVVGCVALIPGGDGRCELLKMAVTPAARGHGTGRRLVAAAIDRARELGASTLFLGSNSQLANAVHLYESAGFRHVTTAEVHMPYARADVFMRLVLPQTRSGHDRPAEPDGRYQPATSPATPASSSTADSGSGWRAKT